MLQIGEGSCDVVR